MPLTPGDHCPRGERGRAQEVAPRSQLQPGGHRRAGLHQHQPIQVVGGQQEKAGQGRRRRHGRSSPPVSSRRYQTPSTLEERLPRRADLHGKVCIGLLKLKKN